MKTIAWDVDDVLNDLMRCWFENFWAPVHKGCRLRYEDISENPPHRLLGIDKPLYLKSLDEFRLSKFACDMQPVPETLEWFKKHGSGFRHIALTSRPISTVSAAASWVFKYFGTWIRGFYFVPAPRSDQHIPEYECSKREFLKWIGKVDILVDDSEDNIEAAQEIGIAGVLMPRPWNKNSAAIKETLVLLQT